MSYSRRGADQAAQPLSSGRIWKKTVPPGDTVSTRLNHLPHRRRAVQRVRPRPFERSAWTGPRSRS